MQISLILIPMEYYWTSILYRTTGNIFMTFYGTLLCCFTLKTMLFYIRKSIVQTLYIQKFLLELSFAVLLSKNLWYMPYTFEIISTQKKQQYKISTPLYKYIAPNFYDTELDKNEESFCSQIFFVLGTSILLPPFLPPWSKPTTVKPYYQDFSHTPNSSSYYNGSSRY